MILFETSNQPTILLYCIIIGFICGFIFDVFSLITFLCKNNAIVKCIGDFFGTLFCCFFAFLITYNLNFGQFRLYIIIFFFMFTLLERITLGKLFAKLNVKCYNLFIKINKKLVQLISRTKNGKRKKEK